MTKPRSVRMRVTTAATSVVFLALVFASVGIVASQWRVLSERLDRDLVAQLNEVTDQMSTGSIDLGKLELVQIVDDQGRVLEASSDLALVPPVVTLPATDRVQTVDGIPESDDRARVASRSVATPSGPVWIHVGAALDRVEEPVAVATITLAVATPVITAGLAWLIWAMVGTTLRPVEDLRAEVAQITLSDLSRRVPTTGGDDEIGRLAETMNAMLASLEEASRSQRQFVADASHELRTPLARMRSEIEVDLAHPETADARATSRSVLEELHGIEAMIDDLLTLARAEAGSLQMEDLDLSELVRAELDQIDIPAGVSIETHLSVAPMKGNPNGLVRVFRNLMDNALRHANKKVAVTVEPMPDGYRLRVSDDGPGIRLDDQVRVFDRFTRTDEARGSEQGGAGLGLSIVSEVVHAHRGSVQIDPGHHPGTSVVVHLPGES